MLAVRYWFGKAYCRLSKLEGPAICHLELFCPFLCRLFEHPASAPLSSVDVLPEVLCKNNFSFVCSLGQFWAASEPDWINIVGCVMIIVIVRNRHYPSCCGCSTDSLASLVPRSKFSWMGHKPESWAESHARV